MTVAPAAIPSPAPRWELSGAPSDVLSRLQNLVRPDGILVDRDILADAESPTSPLHGYFEWDDSKAAAAHRLQQAGNLIRRVRVTVIQPEQPEPIRVRAFVSRKAVETITVPAPGEYVQVKDLANTQQQQALLASINRDLERLRRKYSNNKLLLDALRSFLEEKEEESP